MRRIDASRWALMTPVLDELLYVDKAGCAVRLAQTRSKGAALAEDVAYFLAQRTGIASDDFPGGHALDLVVDAGGGEAVGNYTLERELGQGGMGPVWLARQVVLHRLRGCIGIARCDHVDDALVLGKREPFHTWCADVRRSVLGTCRPRAQPLIAACAAASRAIGTRYGEQLT